MGPVTRLVSRSRREPYPLLVLCVGLGPTHAPLPALRASKAKDVFPAPKGGDIHVSPLDLVADALPPAPEGNRANAPLPASERYQAYVPPPISRTKPRLCIPPVPREEALPDDSPYAPQRDKAHVFIPSPEKDYVHAFSQSSGTDQAHTPSPAPGGGQAHAFFPHQVRTKLMPPLPGSGAFKSYAFPPILE